MRVEVKNRIPDWIARLRKTMPAAIVDGLTGLTREYMEVVREDDPVVPVRTGYLKASLLGAVNDRLVDRDRWQRERAAARAGATGPAPDSPLPADLLRPAEEGRSFAGIIMTARYARAVNYMRGRHFFDKLTTHRRRVVGPLRQALARWWQA